MQRHFFKGGQLRDLILIRMGRGNQDVIKKANNKYGKKKT